MKANAIKMSKSEREAERRCIVTGTSGSKHGLIRFVIGPERAIVPDLSEKLPGRGFWLSADRDVVGKAVAKGAFAKAARGPVEVNPELLKQLEALLVRRCQEYIRLARRSNQLVVGYDRVLEQLAEGRPALVVVASDAGGARRDVLAAAGKTTVVDVLNNEEVSEAAGKGTVSFAALERGGLATSLQRDCDRLSGIRGADKMQTKPGNMEVKI